jgi:hypothetical protein
MCDPMQERKKIRINQVFFRVVLATLLPQYHGEVARSGELSAACAQAPVRSGRTAKRQRWSIRHEVLPTLPMEIFQHGTSSATDEASTSDRPVRRQKSSLYCSGVADSLEMARADHFQPYEFRAGPEERERWNLLGCGQHYELFHPPRNVLKGFLRCNPHPFLVLCHASQSFGSSGTGQRSQQELNIACRCTSCETVFIEHHPSGDCRHAPGAALPTPYPMPDHLDLHQEVQHDATSEDTASPASTEHATPRQQPPRPARLAIANSPLRRLMMAAHPKGITVCLHALNVS